MVRLSAVLTPCALCLCMACLEPGLSQQREATPDQLDSRSTLPNRNWAAFWRHHIGEWKGRWTRYTPSGDVKETFASSRNFMADPALTAVMQVNRYRYSDGRSVRKQWDFTIEEHSQTDGFAHPASEAMRGLALDNGAAAWLVPTLQTKQFTPFELFLKQGAIRHSVGALYGKNGQLLRTASIREQRGDRSESVWTDAVAHVEPWETKGRWRGEEHQIRSNLSRGPARNATWHWMPTGQSNVFFPDHIILRCPRQLRAGEPFSITVLWLVQADELQRLTAAYDRNARLISVTHQALRPDL